MEQSAAASAEATTSTESSMNESHPFYLKWLKLRMLDRLRKQQDNDAILEMTRQDDCALRQQRHAVREARMKKLGVSSDSKPPDCGDAMGDAFIDSPQTTNHYYPAPQKSNGWLKPLLLGASLLGLGGGAGLAAAWMAGMFERNKSVIEKKLEPQEYELEWQFRDGEIQWGTPKRIDG